MEAPEVGVSTRFSDQSLDMEGGVYFTIKLGHGGIGELDNEHLRRTDLASSCGCDLQMRDFLQKVLLRTYVQYVVSVQVVPVRNTCSARGV